MKLGIDHFPEQTQEELAVLLEQILHFVPACNMIILYGSYPRNKFVMWDERLENGVRTSYQSDFDILVVVSTLNYRITECALRNKVTKSYKKILQAKYPHATPPQFIVENIKALKDNVEHRHYFFTDLVQEGIVLYDDKKYELPAPRELNFREIRDVAKCEFEMYSESAEDILKQLSSLREVREPLSNPVYQNRAFNLHQVCEKCYYAILLVHTNYKPKNHRLIELGSMAKGFSPELAAVFPQNTPFARECYDIVCRAYVEGRYISEFKITLEQLLYLLSRVEYLYDITKRICLEKIAWYDSQLISLENNQLKPYPLQEEPGKKAAESEEEPGK